MGTPSSSAPFEPRRVWWSGLARAARRLAAGSRAGFAGTKAAWRRAGEKRVRQNAYWAQRLDVAEPGLELNPVSSRIVEEGNAVEITFNGPGMIFASPNHCLCSMPAIELLPGQTTGEKPARSALGEFWKRNGERWLGGGGDVILNALQPHSDRAHRDDPQTLELTAGLNRKMGELDLAELLDGDIDFWLSPGAFVAVEPGIVVSTALRKDPSKAALARGPVVYRFRLIDPDLPRENRRPARLWFGGLNGHKLKRFRPGKAHHYYQGYVIGATSNVDCICESPLVYHPTRRDTLDAFKKHREPSNFSAAIKGAAASAGKVLRWCLTGQIDAVRHWIKIQLDSVASGEGFVRYTLRNNSESMGYVLVQSNRNLVPDMPGLTGLLFRPLSWALRNLPRLH